MSCYMADVTISTLGIPTSEADPRDKELVRLLNYISTRQIYRAWPSLQPGSHAYLPILTPHEDNNGAAPLISHSALQNLLGT